MTWRASSVSVLWPLALLLAFVGTFRRVVTDSTSQRAVDCRLTNSSVSVAARQTPLDVAAIERCVAEDPENVEFLIDLGTAHQAAGRDDLAEAAYRRAIAVDPRDGSVHVRLGELLLKRGDRAGAHREAESALRWHPGSAHALKLAALSASPAALASDQ